MSLRPSGQIRASRPDNTSTVVGGEGVEVLQDTDGTQIQRLGIPGAEADWGPGEKDITDTNVAVASPKQVGGTNEASGIVRSLDNEPCTVAFVWSTGENDYTDFQNTQARSDTLIESPPAITNDPEHTIESVTTKADHAAVFVIDESAQGVTNNIEYTLNFH